MYPHKITLVDSEINKEMMKDFRGERQGFCQIGPKQYVFPLKFIGEAEGIYNMPVRSDDVWIATIPRSGTTWCQEMVWLINNNLDYENAAKTSMLARFPFMELNSLFCDEFLEELAQINNHSDEIKGFISNITNSNYRFLKDLPSPRHIKTHLAFSLLPPKLLDTCKVIYVARNPLDVAVSFYHHNRLLRQHDFNGDFERYWEYYKNGYVVFFPYWDHVLEAWELRNHHNMLFLFYEDLIMDLPKTIKKVSMFLNKPMTEEEIAKLAAHLHIDNFRKVVPAFGEGNIKGLTREGEQGFVRKGKVGDTPEFTEELKKEATKWVRENLAKTNLKFPSNWKI